MKEEQSADWEDVSDDPDPDDLGYEAVELDMIGTTADGTHRVLVLPTDEEMLADEAFLVADEDCVEELPAMI
jgi:hypothetical protein